MTGFDVSRLAAAYPRLYHMAEVGSWPSIQKHGLLSTSALLDLFEVKGEDRVAVESAHRPTKVVLTHPVHGTAVVRDQKPMSDAALLKCLRGGMTPRKWYELLNRHVFFWLSRSRLDRLLRAKAYRSERHIILEVDSDALLRETASHTFLTHINTGSTLFRPQPRDAKTFSRLADYPYDIWRRKRRHEDAIVELAVRGAVSNVEQLVIRVTEEGCGRGVRTIWRRRG